MLEKIPFRKRFNFGHKMLKLLVVVLCCALVQSFTLLDKQHPEHKPKQRGPFRVTLPLDRLGEPLPIHNSLVARKPTPKRPQPKQSCTCGVINPNGATRIVGGTQTQDGEIPWRVNVFIYDPSTGRGFVCGGTIISPNWVMTAAHCTADFQNGYAIDVYTGAQANPVSVGGGTKNQVDRYVQHPRYDSQTMDNDISLLHLSAPLSWKSSVSPACLPFSMTNSDFSGIEVLASGWGTTEPVPVGVENTDPSSQTLLKVTLPALSTSECQQYLGNAVGDNQICTYNPGYDTCQGDSGGSIDYENPSNSFYYAIGVVSWGNGCAQEDNPGVYTKVTKYLSWITSTTGDSFCQL